MNNQNDEEEIFLHEENIYALYIHMYTYIHIYTYIYIYIYRSSLHTNDMIEYDRTEFFSGSRQIKPDLD